MQMSAEEQMLLAQEFDNMIDEMTKGMSEQEKNKFINDIVDEVEKISKMDEEQFANYVNKLESDMKTYGLLPEQQAGSPAAQPQQVPAPTTKAPEIRPEPSTKKPSRDMVPTIDEIIKHLDSLIQKSNQFTEIAANFSKWGEKGKLRGWNPTMTWAVFKGKIDVLKSTFATIKASDSKTGKPKYLADLASQEALCNNISQFNTVLKKHEPKIQVPSFGLKAISEESKNAFIDTINDCLEALFALNLQTELEKIIAKYEPTAKKIKEAEERAQQAALEAGRYRPSTPSPMRTTSHYGEEPGYYEFGGIQDKNPFAPTSYGHPSYGPIPDYAQEKKDTRASGSEKTQASPPAKDTTPKKEDFVGPSSKKEDVKETEATKKIEQKYIDFSIDLDQAFEFLNDIEDGIRRHIQSNDPSRLEKLTSDIKALTNYLNTAKKSASAARTALSGLDKDIHKTKWIKNFQSYWNKQSDSFTGLRDFFSKTDIPTSPSSQTQGTQGTQGNALATAREKLQDATREYSIAVNSLNTIIHDIATPAVMRRKRR
jgi:hypothetical protein